ncbi:MAG TPA: DUF308 domain-containing protein [Rhizomicrobium sp.]|jgi:uncharacterized membrane protein HdeD (DUF308 family)|nr:DUF308 domain-containing protein [Rhizomicrobium sp.]
MSQTGENLFHERVRSSSRHFFWIGLALTLLGIVAIVFPMISTLVATLLMGWLLFVAGLFTLLGSFAIRGTGPFFGALLLSLLSLGAGLFLLSNPSAGALVLTMLLALLFLVEGAFEIVLALEMRPFGAWVWMMLAAFASIVLGLFIAAGLPIASTIVLGVIMGLNFLSTGIGYLILSRDAASR